MKPHTKEQLRIALSDFPSLSGSSEAQQEAFCQFYELVLKWNPILHLTTILSPVEFAERHIYESAFALPQIRPSVRQIIDIGSGGGVPGVPLAILRPDLQVTLVESNKKKAIFLKEVAGMLPLKNLQVLRQRFEELADVGRDVCLTSRALDGMTHFLPKLIELGSCGAQMLVWGNDELLRITQPPPGWNCSSFSLPTKNNSLLISLTRFT